MPSDSKWVDRRLARMTHELERDDTLGMEREESPLKKWIVAGAIAAGGVAAYKSGLLKNGIKKAIEYAGEYKPFIAEARTAAEQWSRKQHWDDLESAAQPQLSVLRRNVKTESQKAAAKAGEEIIPEKIGLGRFLKDADFRGHVISDTLRDVSDLRSMVRKKTTKAIESKAKSAPKELGTNTELMQALRTIAKTNKELTTINRGHASNQVRNTMVAELIERSSQSVKDAKLKINRTGYKNLTLGDLFELNQEKKAVLKINQQGKWDIQDRIRQKDGTFKIATGKHDITQFRQLMDDFMEAEVKVNDGFKKLKDTDLWKDVKIDSNLFIDEAGKIIDTRGAAKEMNEFVRSASNNFQIPIIGINPLRLFGVGNGAYKRDQFGLLHGNTVNPLVTKKAGHQATINNVFGESPIFFAGDKIFQFKEGEKTAQLIGQGFEFNNMDKMSKRMYGMTQPLNSLHTLSELNYKTHVEYTKDDGFIKNMWGKIGRKLDIGRQDRLGSGGFEPEGIYKYMSPDYYVDNFAEKIGSKIKTSKATFDNFDKPGMGKKPSAMNVYGYAPDDVRHFVAVKKSFKLNDAFNPESEVTFTQFAKQFVAGRTKDGRMEEEVTGLTLAVFDTINRASQSLAPFGLDLSVHSKRNVLDLTKNLVLKRALPAYMAYQSYEYINYLTESDPDGDGNPDNITKKVARAIKDIDMGVHVWKDSAGMTQLQKDLKPLLPGFEQTPVGMVVSDQSAEERLDWYENGVSEVRKGRWWALGNTPFTGGKIEYFQANWYRRVMADARFSDSLYGSREEYFANAWFPTLTHPLAPVRHFITDRYHYDERNANSRPYLMTSGLFGNVPFFGPTLDATVGAVLKPRRRMHREYWGQVATTPSQHEVIQDQQQSAEVEFAMQSEAGMKESNLWQIAEDDLTEAMPEGNAGAGLPMALSGPANSLDREALPGETQVMNAYVTPSGSVSVVGMRADENLMQINQRLSKYSLNKLAKIDQRPDVAGIQEEPKPFQAPYSPTNLSMAATSTFDQVTNLQGMKGFLISGMVTGSMDLDGPAIETGDYAYSFNRAFWDSNIGGAGGGLMEIARRFIPNRRKDVDWVNPVRNTMPDWLPGEEYFTDFKHGDPYTKIAKGELRLPGEGYERLHGIGQVNRLELNDAYLGRDAEEIKQHLLLNDASNGIKPDTYQLTKEAKQTALSQLRETHTVISEGKWYNDRENGIKGTYDAMIEDQMSATGRAIVKFKALSSEEFKQVDETMEVDEQSRLQVNFQLHATNNYDSNGYVMYVNREDPSQTRMLQVEYNENDLQQAMSSVNQARSSIQSDLDSGKINNGALYSQVDRLRILADVAPYSDAYRKQKAIVSAMELDDETKAEVQAINSRVAEQKEPHRITPYRFKTANVKTETVTIIKSLGNDKFLTLEHRNNPIKLAGINVKNVEEWDMTDTSDVVSDYLKPGRRVQISYDADPGKQISNDSLGTIRASVSYRGQNINRALVEEGVAEFKEDDYSPAAVHARFSAAERMIGSAWESFAHLHTPLHTKLLQVRSGLEAYKRREVYGKDFQRWTNPIQDYLEPMIRENTERDLIPGIVMGAFLGSLFGAKGSPYGKMMGASIGVGTYLVGKTFTTAEEKITGKKWIPKVREQERELEEYIDKLKYVKNRRLYAHYKELAQRENGFDVEAYLKSNEYEGRKNKREIAKLNAKKKRLKLKDGAEDFDLFGQTIDMDPIHEKRIKNLTGKINALKGGRRVDRLSDNAIKAIHYYNEAEKTMYGYDPGDPLTNLLTALPKRDRQYMKYFIDAPEEERAEILKVAPSYMRRALASTWGYGSTKKESLEEYFSEHALPGEEWSGWQEDVNLDDVRVKLIKKAGLDFSEFDVWDDQVEQANHAGYIALPNYQAKINPYLASARLKSLLTKQGLEDVRIEVARSSSQTRATLKLVHDSRDDIEEALRNYELLD